MASYHPLGKDAKWCPLKHHGPPKLTFHVLGTRRRAVVGALDVSGGHLQSTAASHFEPRWFGRGPGWGVFFLTRPGFWLTLVPGWHYGQSFTLRLWLFPLRRILH